MTKQHIVPQFYLKNFSISNRKDYIYAYQRNEKIIETNVKNIAVVKDIYTYIHKKISKNEVIDKVFTDMETRTAPIIKKLIKTNNLKLTKDEKTEMAWFISRLYLSSLGTKTKTKNFLIGVNKLLIDSIAKNRWVLKRYLKKLGIKMKWKYNIDEYKKIALGKISEEFSKKEYFFSTILEFLPKLVPIIINKNWYILESSSSRVFITSDNPVSNIRSNSLSQNYRILFGPEVISLPLLHFLMKVAYVINIILLPLSPKRCLFLVNWETREVGKDIIEAPRYIVNYINKNIAYFAHKFIFSNIRSQDIQNIFNETVESEYEKFKITPEEIKG